MWFQFNSPTIHSQERRSSTDSSLLSYSSKQHNDNISLISYSSVQSQIKPSPESVDTTSTSANEHKIIPKPWLRKPFQEACEEEVVRIEPAIITPQQKDQHNQTSSSLSLKGYESFSSFRSSSFSSLQWLDENDCNKSTRKSLTRHLSLFDLISIGVGATIGSGIFVLCGLIAKDYAGPATFVSWGIAGISACASGLCYAELSSKFAVAGSSYTYAYVSMGELPAVIAGACLTLEYVFSASAVARSWGDKMVEYLKIMYLNDDDASFTSTLFLYFIDPGFGLNPMAFIVSLGSVFLLLNGIKESQAVTNFFTVFKVILVLFMSFGALSLIQKENFHPFIPAKFGFAGVLRGSTSSFFGYIGYDEICCMAGEAKNPSKNLPKAVLGTIGIVTLLYMLAAIALVGMVPFEEISATSAFPDGFRTRGIEWASQVTAIGELIALPIVVLVTIMAQPRLQFAMATDGLLPSIFGHIDDMGNLWYGTLFSGILMVIISTCVPFTYLNDLISAGILVAFNMTDSSVILLRRQSPIDCPLHLERLLGWFNFLSFAFGFLLRHGCSSTIFLQTTTRIMCSILFIGILSIVFFISNQCPDKDTLKKESTPTVFETPMVPHLPLFGIFLNWYLIGQLEMTGILLLLMYIGSAILYYFFYAYKHSVGNKDGW